MSTATSDVGRSESRPVATAWRYLLAWFGFTVATSFLALASLLPGRSLLTDADGATLVPDALLGLLVGGVAAWAAWFTARLLRRRTGASSKRDIVALATGASFGVIVFMGLAAQARYLAVATLYDGVVSDPDSYGLLSVLVQALLVAGVAIALLFSGDRATRFLFAAAFGAALWAAALLGFSAWTLAFSNALRAAAEARVHATPAWGLLGSLAALALAAWLRRGGRPAGVPPG